MGVAAVKRAFKFRFYPTDAQAAELARTFGCVRKVHNPALTARSEAWTARGERVTYGETSAMLTAWKRTEEFAYLNDVSSVPLQQALRHLQAGFADFFARRAGHPRFKSRKKSRDSAEYTSSGFRWRDGSLTLAKMGEPLDIVWSRSLPEGALPSTVTVSRDSACRWFVTMLCEDQSGLNALPPTESTVGIDVGITSLVTLSAGEKITNPRHEQRDRERLARAQRILSRKQIESENRDKARIKVARVHARIVDRCGVIRADLPLEVREWTCVCGMVHDRDVNAARNILAAGLAVAACGDGVRPQRSTPGRRSSAKQEMVPPRRARAAAQP